MILSEAKGSLPTGSCGSLLQASACKRIWELKIPNCICLMAPPHPLYSFLLGLRHHMGTGQAENPPSSALLTTQPWPWCVPCLPSASADKGYRPARGPWSIWFLSSMPSPSPSVGTPPSFNMAVVPETSLPAA